jgi:hypothetical protein
MLKKIELWNFESHEHTVIDNLSPDLNLIVGESNAGKSSAIRALKLVAYNEFDPKSVRVGCTKCVVEVTTLVGSVKVTRGPKDNLWEIKKHGQPDLVLDKVGKGIVQAAAEVIGLHMVKLGDVDVSVNVMDQLAAHFLLSEIGGKDASGSMRAQIVDEISGLSGIEGLIKDVGLDYYRFGREMKDVETQMEEVRTQLHPELELNKEAGVLGKAETLLEDHIQLNEIVGSGTTLYDSSVKMKTQINDIESNLNRLPDSKLALVVLDKTKIVLDKAEDAEKLFQEGSKSETRISGIDQTLVGIPDVSQAVEWIKQTDEFVKKMQTGQDMWDRYVIARDGVQLKSDRLLQVESMLDGVSWLDVSKVAQDRFMAIQTLIDQSTLIFRKIAELDSKMKLVEEGEMVAVKDRDDILASITVCPLSLRPVSKECLV